jgi:anti-sigma regulatory factor (Ser/Thr protein kinase)
MPPPVAGRGVQVSSTGDGSETETVFDERFDAGTLHLLRERVAACVAAVGVPKDRAVDIILALHELAANAVRHGAGSGRLLIQAVAGALRCQVSDAGPGVGPWPLRQGHGLWIVREVADQFVMSPGTNGSQVTALFGWQDEPRRDRPGRAAT